MDTVWPDWPIYGLVDDIRPELSRRAGAGETVALATLIATDGPSPRPAGAQMLVAADGSATGYVSGGCVEAAVAAICREAIANGRPRRLVFGEGSPWFDIRLVCGTRIEVAVERAPADCPAVVALLAAHAARRPIGWVSRLDRSGRDVIAVESLPGDGPAGVSPDHSRFWKRFEPAPRLMVFGSDPVALALARLADLSGFETILARRAGPPLAPPLPHGRYRPAGPAETLEAEGLDAWTAVVTTTHDLEEDAEALAPALASDAFYVGALGSRRRLDARRDQLAARGATEDQLSRLRSPVGLDIGAATANEIAVSILADVIAARRGIRLSRER
jgi:xanthine dehydrogenase accessory factor